MLQRLPTSMRFASAAVFGLCVGIVALAFTKLPLVGSLSDLVVLWALLVPVWAFSLAGSAFGLWVGSSATAPYWRRTTASGVAFGLVVGVVAVSFPEHIGRGGLYGGLMAWTFLSAAICYCGVEPAARDI